MINVQLFKHSSHLAPYLEKYLGGTDQVSIITPNPLIADMARSQFSATHQSVETFTIAGFIKNELKALYEPTILENFRGKSELNLLLGSLWRIKNGDQDYELYKRSFQLLTDFRSFTLNSDILETILENYDESLSHGVLWFHKVLQQMDIIDEHRSYFMLAERLREGDLPALYPQHRSLIFWGFDFLTGSQVDLLKALSIRDDVLIPFSYYAYQKANDLDWIKWLTRFESEVTEIDELTEPSRKLNFGQFPKNYLAATIKNLKENTFKEKSIDLVLGTKNLSQEHAAEIPYGDYTYKVSTDLFSEKQNLFEEYLREEFNHVSSLNEIELKEFCHTLTQESLEKEDFRFLKVISTFLLTWKYWKELTEENNKISLYDMKILLDSLELDLPRNSVFNSSKNLGVELKSLKSLEASSNADITLVIVTADYDPLKGSVVQYTESVEKYLGAIGPIRRSELEFSILKSKLVEKLSEPNWYLIMEDGLAEHDLGWNSVLESFELKSLSINLNESLNKKYYFPEIKSSYDLKSLSASKLQNYIDCPRKFYLNYGLKQKPRIEMPHELNFLQLGLIEHKVIEDYLTQYSLYQEDKLDDLIDSILSSYEEKGHFPPERKEEYFLEIKALCTNIIQDLVEFNQIFGLNLKFEKDLSFQTNNLEIKGSIDCFGHNQEYLLILDFKRGGGSIPSQVGLKNFDKIQLWFYLNQLKKMGFNYENKKLIWGYVNLSKLEESLIYTNDPVTLDQFKVSQLHFLKKSYLFDESMSDIFIDYQNFEAEMVNNIKVDTEFHCNPKEPKVCQYCDLSSICPRDKGVENG